MTGAGWLSEVALRLYLRAVAAARDDRGDVPGWVLITVMTAALVAALYAIAGPKLTQLLTQALDKAIN